jgi:hypothetical protein
VASISIFGDNLGSLGGDVVVTGKPAVATVATGLAKVARSVVAAAVVAAVGRDQHSSSNSHHDLTRDIAGDYWRQKDLSIYFTRSEIGAGRAARPFSSRISLQTRRNTSPPSR